MYPDYTKSYTIKLGCDTYAGAYKEYILPQNSLIYGQLFYYSKWNSWTSSTDLKVDGYPILYLGTRDSHSTSSSNNFASHFSGGGIVFAKKGSRLTTVCSGGGYDIKPTIVPMTK